MAELLLKVGDSLNPKGFKDGDIIHAMNRERIRCTHAEHICHVKEVEFNSDGLNPADSLPVHFLENTYQYKFQRVSPTEIMRINLITDETDLIGPTPNEKGEVIRVQMFIDKQKKHPRHRLFGTAGNEFWYGGNVDTANEKLDKVWQKIEELTPNREVNFQTFPWKPMELKKYLVVPTDDFTNAVAAEYERPEIEESEDKDGKPVIEVLQKRVNKVLYQNIVGEKLADIESKEVEVDLRKEVSPFAVSIVTAKTSLRAK